MNLKKIEILNIFLIIVSGVFSIIAPFQLFLFVYAFLGPLHYLTEINWLHDRNYYLQSKKEILWLLFPIICIGLLIYTHTLKEYKFWIPYLIFTTFLSSIYLTKKVKLKRDKLSFIVLLVIGFFCFIQYEMTFKLVFSLFLPTLIHVFLFTGLFLLSGFLKTKNKLSLITLLVFILTSLFVTTYNLNTTFLLEEVGNTYTSFEKLNTALFTLFNKELIASQDIYFSNFGIRIMQFIAFAYTYHYLNWFSKTAIIQWHKTSLIKISIIIFIWLISIILYLINYKLGLYWLYLLSLTHVIFEFPLNILTIKNSIKI